MNTKPALTLVTDLELKAKLEADPHSLELPRGTRLGDGFLVYAEDLRNYRKSGHRNPLEVVS